jgi:hypothetical protein
MPPPASTTNTSRKAAPAITTFNLQLRNANSPYAEAPAKREEIRVAPSSWMVCTLKGFKAGKLVEVYI